MKIKLLFFIICFSCLGLLTGCASERYRFPGNCWRTCHDYGNCDTCVKLPCEHICDACTFKDPACQACWSCVSNDGCSPKYHYNTDQYITKYTYSKYPHTKYQYTK